MKNVILSAVVIIMIYATACNNEGKKEGKPFADEANKTNVAETLTQKSQGTITINIDDTAYTFEMSDDKSELMFYTKESILNVDAACKIQSADKKSRVNISVEGLGKGKDEYKGNVSISKSHSLANFRKGETDYTFIEGDMEIQEFSKKTGKVKLKVTGTGTMRIGKSYKDMKLDVPAEMEINVTIPNVRTLNHTKSNQ